MAFHDLKKFFSLFLKKSSSGIFFRGSSVQVWCDLSPIGSAGPGCGGLWDPDVGICATRTIHREVSSPYVLLRS